MLFMDVLCLCSDFGHSNVVAMEVFYQGKPPNPLPHPGALHNAMCGAIFQIRFTF